jgi:hypothetical protein
VHSNFTFLKVMAQKKATANQQIPWLKNW